MSGGAGCVPDTMARATPSPRRLAPRQRLLWLLLGVVVLAAACGGGDSSGGDAAADTALGDLPATEFEMSDGTRATFADFRGEPLVVNFFASWCAPCRAEMPDFEAVHQEVGDRVSFLGFDLQDTRSAGAELVELTGVTYPWALDPDGDIYRAFEGFGMPTTVYVSPEGEVLGKENGAINADILREKIEEHFGVSAT